MATTAGTLVLKYLTGDFPASREDLLTRAQDGGADAGVLGSLRRLPDVEYGSPGEVRTALEHTDR
jgi:hypothetical protein